MSAGTAISGGFYPRRSQAAIKLQVVVDHTLRGKALARTGVGKVGISAAHFAIRIERADALGQAGGVVGAEVQRRVSPDLTKAGNVVGYDRATGECGIESRHAQRFVA